ncbi:endonuclease I family protein [Arenicella xantha]|uniref:endonuclease I family protein n=1 Tax=Arenicella xantha TaxID=644221 RepID=UPI001473D3D9|nr:endonuclease [Arenicella xantha]
MSVIVKRVAVVALMLAAVWFFESYESASEQGTRAANSPPQQVGAKQRNYDQARKVFWRNLYPRDGVTLYCQAPFETDERAGFNVEHVFPMSWATSGLKCGKRKQCRASSAWFNQIESDLHNLYPARSDVNQARSSYRFGEVKGEVRRYGETCDFEVDERARVAEPTPAVRGEVARAMFYMAFEYRDQGLMLFDKQAKLLQQWHRADPPSAAERRRNDIIEKLQGNRNPFIDRPEYLDELYRQGYFSQ